MNAFFSRLILIPIGFEGTDVEITTTSGEAFFAKTLMLSEILIYVLAHTHSVNGMENVRNVSLYIDFTTIIFLFVYNPLLMIS